MKESKKADLHNHTSGSDGRQSPLMFLLRAHNRGKEKVSITDHSSIKGYKQLEEQVRYFAEKALKSNDIIAAKRILKVLDQTNLIPGVEIITSYKGVIIEILGYNINIDLLDEKLQEKSQGLKTTKEVLYNGLNRVIDETGITFDRSVIENVNALVGPFYKELMSHEENKRLFEDISSADTLKKFIYNYLYNPSSSFFIDMSQTKPKIQDVIQMIHEAGGKASLAHAGRYKSLNMKEEIDEIISMGLDAIEVNYPDHNMEYRKFLLDKVKEYGLVVTGGSDDHRNPKEGEQYKMGSIDIPNIKESEWIETSENFLNQSKTISDFKKRLRVMIDSDKKERTERIDTLQDRETIIDKGEDIVR